MLKYRTVDYYEGFDILYKGTDLKEARKARRQQRIDTDEECDVVIQQLVHIVNDDGERVAVWQTTSY